MNKRIIPVILLSLFAFASCTKTARVTPDPVPFDSTTLYTYSMSSIYTSLKNMPKTITMNPALGGTFVGNSGTVYTFPANAFQTVSGGSVVGNITLELTEYVKRGDMIFSRVLPVNDSNALVSGGELLVNASQGGGKLRLKPGVLYTAKIPQLGAISTGMSFYYGQPYNPSLYSLVNWVPNTSVSITAPSVIYNGDTLIVGSDSVGYSAPGRLLTGSSFQSFTLNVGGVTFDDSDHVQAYALYDNYRVVYPMKGRFHQHFTENHVPNIPLHFVVYTVWHGDFYAGISTASVTPATGATYTVNLAKVNPITFLATVNGL